MLTGKMEKFCQKYVELDNASAAYREAYDCNKMKSATVNSKACILLKKGNIRARVDELREEHKKRHEVTVDRIVDELEKMAFIDPRKFYREDGTLKEVVELDLRTAGGLVSLEVEELFEGRGEDREHIGRVKKLKMADKKGALDSLARVFGAFKDTVKVVEESYEEKIARMEAEEKEKNSNE